MGSAGEIVLDGTQPRIDRDGRIFEEDKLVGQLKIVSFADPQGLRRVGAGAFVATPDNPALPREARVRQGHVENSNVVTVDEMVRLIETMRHFESNQKLIQGYDELQERVIRTLGSMFLNTEETRMIDALYIAATGMNAQQLQVDTIANNLANLDTPAFKKGRVSFEDLMYRELARAGAAEGDAAMTVDLTWGSGLGVSVAGTGKVMTQGDFKKTDQPLDLAIRGAGFFEVTMADGSRAYTRAGNLQLDRERMLSTLGGLPLSRRSRCRRMPRR